MPLTRPGPILLAATALAVVAGAAAAEPATGEMRLSLGYDGRLLVKVLDVEVNQRIGATSHSSTSRLTSSGILAAFKRIDVQASSSGPIVRGDPRPGAFANVNFASKAHRKATVTWNDGDVSAHATPPFSSMGDTLPTRAQKLAAADPLTQLMRMTLNGDRASLCRQTYHFFDGKQLYDLQFSNPRSAVADGRDKRLGLVNPLRCDVRYIEVAGFKKKPPKKVNGGLTKPMAVEFAQLGTMAGPWVLSGLHAQTPLGAASIDLQRVTVTGKPPA